MESKPVPPVNPLRDEIDKLMSKNKRGNTPEDAQDIIKASWSVRKMCGFVKMKARRKEVSTVTWPTLGLTYVQVWLLNQCLQL